MRKLSINIPTYNRDMFLKKNIEIIIQQLRDGSFINDVELNISDNASTDLTPNIVESIMKQNTDIKITYIRKEKNEGPDSNFISAMKMAKGEYSILFGDDDFFIENGISNVLSIIRQYPEIGIISSNRTNIDVCGNIKNDSVFLSEEVPTRIFDFSDYDQLVAYFASCSEYATGGLLSFISTVIYKTAILNFVGEYNEKCNGTCYSFLYYWWSYLTKGKKLLYWKHIYCLCTTTGATNCNYGKNLKRIMVDTNGLTTIEDICFVNEYSNYKKYFCNVIKNCNQFDKMTFSFMLSPQSVKEEFLESLLRSGYSERFIHGIRTIHSFKYFVKGVYYSFFNFLKDKK